MSNMSSMRRTTQVLDPTRLGKQGASFYKGLRRLVVGQDEALDSILTTYQTHLVGMSAPGRPAGTFLFLGPTGTGKTRMVEASAEALLDDPKGITKVDCAEFQHSHEIAKLIGSPPGYLGHRETIPMLSQEVINQHQTRNVKLNFVLFDEIEKASDALWNLLLGILDRATLTLGDTRRVDFSQTLIFMTSNLGASEINSLLAPRFGLQGDLLDQSGNTFCVSEKASRASKVAFQAARRRFSPEFMNRIDKTVFFQPFSSDALAKILELELDAVQKRVALSSDEAPFVFTVSDEVKAFLLSEGTDTRYWARHLKRAVARLIVQPLANLRASHQVQSGDAIDITLGSDGRTLEFTRIEEKLDLSALARVMSERFRRTACSLDLNEMSLATSRAH